MNNEELDSQLSAMFDDELPGEECELLARRLARDEALKARWGRYAAIGAAMRAERGVALDGALARRVSAAIASEPALLTGAAGGSRVGRSASRLARWSQPLAGAAVAAAVAFGAIVWLRTQTPLTARPAAGPSAAVLVARAPVPGSLSETRANATSAPPSGGEPDSYTVPAAVEQNSTYQPPAELANFVVAHSAFSAPFLRRNVLSALVEAEAVTATSATPHEARGIEARRARGTDAAR